MDRQQPSANEPSANEPTVVRDAIGRSIFCASDTGKAHVAAHRHLDSGQFELGHRELSAWLEGRTGSGSEWTHIQWHMLIFEIEVGDVASAQRRFNRHILPAIASGDALTDGPSALWRLQLAADEPMELPWERARDAALEYMAADARVDDCHSPFVALHNLLAIAGSGAAAPLRRWVRQQCLDRPTCLSCRTLLCVAKGLLAYATHRFGEAGRWLDHALPDLASLGGSSAQNDLVAQIRKASLAR